MTFLSVLNPVATTDRPKIESAKRLRNLSGKTIGLYRNAKFGGDILLDYAAELLNQRYSGMKFKRYGPYYGSEKPEQFDNIAKEVDAVISGVAD
jgi:hypothetical protein